MDAASLQGAPGNLWESSGAARAPRPGRGRLSTSSELWEAQGLPWVTQHTSDRQGQCKVWVRDNPGWAFLSPRACPALSLPSAPKALVSKLPMASVLGDGFPHHFPPEEKVPGKGHVCKELEGLWLNGYETLRLPAGHRLSCDAASTRPRHVAVLSSDGHAGSMPTGGTEALQGSDQPRAPAERRVCSQSPSFL